MFFLYISINFVNPKIISQYLTGLSKSLSNVKFVIQPVQNVISHRSDISFPLS